jgi:hypothetical protein
LPTLPPSTNDNNDAVLYLLSLWRNRWLPSEFSHLPAAEGGRDPARADYLLLARTLAQVLVLCTPRGAQRDFPAALQAYRAIKPRLRPGRAPCLPAQLLSDMSHEIALYADRTARDAALRCLRRSQGSRVQPARKFASGDHSAAA